MHRANTTAFPFPDMDLTNEVILYDNREERWLYFRKPIDVITAYEQKAVRKKLRHIEKLTQSDGLYAAGFISYEASPAFDDALQVKQDNMFPLLWFGIYEEAVPVSLPATVRRENNQENEWTPIVNEKDYSRALDHIKRCIASGDTYQVNFTTRLYKSMTGNGWYLFQNLLESQKNGYPAYINTDDFTICSASPELFFRLDGDSVTTRPMKGTAPRGRFYAEDLANADWLRKSRKNQAENLMIVDMIRNDLARIAKTGSVHVENLFEIEKYSTVWQMTSTINARTETSISDIIQALFPCASITGAPKVRTMKIISQLETSPRKIYTGTIGYIGPGRKAQFNVAIRTVLIDRNKQVAEYGVGGGIVWDSNASEEYEECRVKSRILSERRPVFSLLETILWTPDDGYVLLDEHMQRLSESASYFDYPFDKELITNRLYDIIQEPSPQKYKIRLLLDDSGSVTIQKHPLVDISFSSTVRLALAAEPIDSSNIFLYHKTTNRSVYSHAKSSINQECDDVILWNERGEVTETTIANIVVEMDGRLFTPPVTCGLLPGTYRNCLLKQKRIVEKVITLNMLVNCDQLFLINSVRLWRPVRFLESVQIH